MAIWAGLIFTGSTDLLSEGNTSRFLRPFLRWLKPDLSDTALDQVQYAIRKTGHATEYAILALLLLRALAGAARIFPQEWSGRSAVLALAGCCLFAVGDEVHQAFVPSRHGSPFDVLIDAAGAALGLWAVWWNLQRTERKRGRP